MRISTKKQALTGAALAALLSTTGANAAADSAAIEARLRMLEAEIAKLRHEARDAKTQAQRATNVANAAIVKGPPGPPPPPPVFVSFKNGLFVETADKSYNFKIGGRIQVDGGGIAEPLNGFSNQAGFRRVRLEVEGKAANVWFYKLQYDFAGSPNGSTLGGIRDAFLGLQHPALTLPFAKDPIFFQVGSLYEPFSLDALNSSKYIDFIERSMAADAFAPYRHIGAAVGAYGDNWTAKGGVYTTSFEDAGLNPAFGTPATLGVPRFPGTGTAANSWWVPTGGGQYWDLTGRLTYAPIKDEHDLIHIGVAGRYHRPNEATGLSDDRVLRLGNRLRSEANILGQAPLGTVDLSCGSVTIPGSPLIFNTSTIAGKCVRDVVSYGVELAAAHGPLSVQAEYMGSQYNRNSGALVQSNLAGLFTPGGVSHNFNGYYVYGQWYVTGEERAEAYSVKDKNGASFEQVKIKDPLSKGGPGAWSLAARYSSINLNSGGFQGSTLYNLLALTTFVAPNPFARAVIANSGINGGRQENVTVGLNWYPDNGFHFQANYTRVLNLIAPLNGNVFQGAYLNGAHPSLFEVRAQVYW